MKPFTIEDIRSWNPCYDPARHLLEGWAGTALDMLENTTIPDKDKLWLIRRYAVMSAKGLRLFAVDCARRAQTYPENYVPDPRTLAAIETAERFANGDATEVELEYARDAAYAAYAAAAARAAAGYTAYAARAAAADAARAAARAAAADADDAAARAAGYTAYAARAADAAERKLQIVALIEMYKSGRTGLFVEK